MSAPICPEHGLEAQVKSGLRYKKGPSAGRTIPPFYGCPWTGTDESGARVFCSHRFEEKPSQAATMAAGSQAATAASTNKDQQIKFMNALNCATDLMAAQIIPVDIDWHTTLKETASMIYRIVPPE